MRRNNQWKIFLKINLNLLNHFEIKNKLVSMHDHNEEIVKNEVLHYLLEGKNVAIVTDRGTPIISDPGYKAVKLIKDSGYNVIALPGACAFVPALVASSISSEHFLFYGFSFFAGRAPAEAASVRIISA